MTFPTYKITAFRDSAGNHGLIVYKDIDHYGEIVYEGTFLECTTVRAAIFRSNAQLF